MKRITYFIIALALFMVPALPGCIDPPSYPDEPEIEYVGLTNNNPATFDTFTIQFSFTDGDGDIGFEEAVTDSCNFCDSSCYSHPSFTLFLTDSRTGCLSTYNVPHVPPKGSFDDIAGEVFVVPPQACCIQNVGSPCLVEQGKYDTLTYTIQLKDRAGNFSNVIETAPIIINCGGI